MSPSAALRRPEPGAAASALEFSALADVLDLAFRGRLSRPLIRGHVLRAWRDLRGSVSVEGRPEMVIRLARVRLELLIEAQDARAPSAVEPDTAPERASECASAC